MKFRSFIFLLLSLHCMAVNAQTYYAKKNGEVKIDSGNYVVVGHVKEHLATGVWTSYGTTAANPKYFLGIYNFRKTKSYIAKTINYVNGLPDGEMKMYSEYGTLIESGNYSLGKKNGEWTNFNLDGTKRSTVNFVRDTLDGVEEGYFPNQKLSVRYLRVMGVMTLHEVYSESGVLLMGSYYKDGKADGRWIFNPDKTMFDSARSSYTDYVAGKRNGEMQSFTNDGSRVVSHYRNDTLNGLYTSYDSKGGLKMTGYYVNGKPDGKWKTVYPSGQMLIEFYSPPTGLDSSFLYSASSQLTVVTRNLDNVKKKIFVINYDTTTGTISDYGIKMNMRKDSTWTSIYPNGKTSARENYVNGLANGPYIVYYPNGKKMFTMHCTKGVVDSSGAVYDAKGKIMMQGTALLDSLLRPWFAPNTDVRNDQLNPLPPLDDAVDEKTIYEVADVMPEFPGGQTEMMKWLQQHLKYPQMAMDMGYQGKVFVRFIVEKDGTVSTVEVKKSSGNKYLDQEAIRVVSMMPKWSPGIMSGKPVRVYFLLPVNFKLQ